MMDRFEQQKQERDMLADQLRRNYLDKRVPDSVANRLFGFAWEEGHAYGDSEVAGYYVELVGLVNEAFEAGFQAGWERGL